MWKQVVAPTVLVSTLWIAVSVGTTFYIRWVYESHARVLTEDVVTIRAAGGMQKTLWKLQAVVMESADKDRHETAREEAELEALFEKHLTRAEETSSTPEEESLVKIIRERFQAYRRDVRQRLESGSDGRSTAQTAKEEQTMRLARAVADPCQDLLEINQRYLDESTTRNDQFASMVTVIRVAFLIAGPVAGVLCGLWVARGFHRSISEISITLKGASGELDQELGSVLVHTPGDLPALRQQVQLVAGRVSEVMDELHTARHSAMLAERLAAVGELAAGVAHELRNPLTSVKLLVQMAAQRQGTSPLGEKQLQVVQQEIARMENTIQGLLDFARPPQLRRVRHDVRETVRRALNLVEGKAKQQGVVICEEFPLTPVVIDGDPEQLHQVFVNLLINGIEAMTQGGTFQVAIHQEAAAGDRGTCEVALRDTGAGIPPQVLGRLFEPFVTSKDRGTGLGLAVSRRIVVEHHGVLQAANREGGGAVFAVTLPLAKTGAADDVRAAARVPALSAGS